MELTILMLRGAEAEATLRVVVLEGGVEGSVDPIRPVAGP